MGNLSTAKLNVLLVEDNVLDAEFVLQSLPRCQANVGKTVHVPTLREAIDYLLGQPAGEVDGVLLDLGLPDAEDLEGLDTIRSTFPEIPIIVLTGCDDEATAAAALRKGAQDYLVKGKFDPHLLGRSLRYARERHAAENQLRRHGEIIDQMADAVILADNDFVITSWNNGAEKIYGWPEHAAVGEELGSVVSSPYGGFGDQQSFDKLVEEGQWRGEIEHSRKDGAGIIVFSSVRFIVNPRGKRDGIVAINRDISEQKALWHQFERSQKMEAVGRLAGGIAHDFNNVLTVVETYARFLLRDLPEGHPGRRDAQIIRESVWRGASFVTRLMAFSRHKSGRHEIVDLNGQVHKFCEMMRPVLREDIELTYSLDPNVGPVQVDKAQVDQMLMNLVVNARDAMPRGGQTIISTKSVALDATRSVGLGISAGRYVIMSVEDTGAGMEDEVIERVFEPFFSTKSEAAGTGLGLFSTFGIARQCGGTITVESKKDVGTRFDIFIPQMEEVQMSVVPSVPAYSLTDAASGNILVVEDDRRLRQAVCRLLSEVGYDVMDARDGLAAEQLVKNHKGEIALVVSDVILPKVDGISLASRLRAVIPQLKFLFITGYADQDLFKQSQFAEEARLLRKPFSMEDLLSAVQESLSILPGESTEPTAPERPL